MRYGLNLEREKSEQSELDWKFGGFSQPCIASIPYDEREQYLPEGEVQRGKEDFMDCSPRALNNLLAVKFNWLLANNKLSPSNVKWFNEKGYIENGKPDFSDRFLAISSGTTREGNSLKSPIDCVRKCGLIPKKMLPASSEMTFDEYHDPQKITNEMKELGKEFAERFKINYEKVYEQHYVELLKDDMLIVAGYAWPIPVDGVYPRTDLDPNHAFMVYKLQYYAFDNYQEAPNDYIKALAPNFNFLDYGYRIFISSEVVPKDYSIIKTVFLTLAKFNLLKYFFSWFQEWNKPDPLPEPTPIPVIPNVKDKLKEAVMSSLGHDLSTITDNNLACAESFSKVIQKVYPDFPTLISTIAIKEHFKTDKRFKPTLDLKEWQVILSVTGTGNGKLAHGHVGFIGENGNIYSNNSYSGKFEMTHTVKEWVDYYRLKGGFKIHVYDLS